MRKKGNVGGSKSSKAIFFCHFGIFLAVAHANVAERSKDDLSSQENDVKGNIYRKEELLNDSDSAESFWNRNGIYDKLRQQKTDWGTDRGCRVQSHKIQRDRCYSPMSHPQSCFGAGLRQNYTIQNDTFGEFPDRLIFLRHFPRCWMRIAPIICLGHYRPCAEIAPTYITNKNADNNFVLLEQFSATACQNMLEQCEFIKHILLGRTVPKYFSCFGDQNYGNSKKRDFSDEKVLYREECKVDYTNVHPELAALANSSFLCLWPLVKSNTMTNNEVSVMTQASPLIDGCYLPCQSPLYPENSLLIFWGFSFVYYSLVALLILCAALTFIQLPSRSQLFPLQFHANILCNFFIYTLFCAFVAILALAFSILPISSNQLFGHFTTCLNTEGGGRIRRYPADFQIPEGKENGLCGLQSIMLNFTTISLNLGLFTILIKCYLLPIRPKLISYLIPSWNSHLLLLQNILLSFAYTLLDLFENKVSVDPVNGFCHFFLHGYSLTLRNSAMFLLITIVVHGLFCFLISIVRKKRKEEIKCSINGQQLLMSMNFEYQQILPRQQNQPERLEMGTGMKTKTIDVQQMHEESEEQQQQLVRQPFDSSGENNIVVMDNEMEPLNGAENYPEDGSDKEAKNSGSERFPFFFTNANILLKKMACLWFFLLAIRIFVGHLLIGAEEESQLILSSINCSIHRTLLEGIPLDWIERQEYRQSPETDPHIRKQMLGSDVSAKFCELSTKSLHWHWIFMLSLGANILLVAFISLIVGQYTDYQRFERELDEKQAERIAMELREMKRRRDEQRRTKSRDGVEEHSGSAVYDKISSTDSLALPINSSDCNRPPPPHPPLTMNPIPSVPSATAFSPAADTVASTIEVHNNSNGSGTSSDITSLFRSHFSLPAVFTRPQCHHQQQQYCYGCYLSANMPMAQMGAASTSAQRQNGQITDEVAPGSGKAQQWLKCFGVAGSSVSTKNNQQTANGGIMRNRAGSDPVQISGQQQKQHYRRRHKLHIRNPPKQAREWRREARERRMENVPQLSSSSIFEQRESERADSRFGEIQQLDGYGKVNPTTTLAPNSHNYYPQQLPHYSPAHLCPYHQPQVQWHDLMFALQQQACCSSAIFTNNMPQFPPFAEFLQYRNVNEAEGNGGEMVDVAAENAESKEENVEEAEIDGEELDDDEEVEQTQGSTTSANPDSSIASSTSDSDPNHSDSPDSFEEKRWEELMRKSSANTPSVDP